MAKDDDILNRVNLKNIVLVISTITVVGGFLFSISSSYLEIGYKINNIENKVNSMQKELDTSKIENRQAVKNLELSQQEQKITQAKTETELVAINKNLNEIKEILKK